MKKLHPILAITLARLREFLRRPEAVFWVYLFPIMMVVVLGIAFRNKPIESFDIDIAISSASEELAERLGSNPQINVHLFDESESLERLRTGKTTLLVKSQSEMKEKIEYIFDPVRPGSLSARNLVDDQLQNAYGRQDVFESADVEYSEPGGRYVDFLVPGLLAMGLMGGGLWGVGFAIVDMRIRKLLKRFMATPMKRTHFLIGMMTSRLIFMIPQIVVLLVFSYLIFGVTIYGDWLSTLLVVVIGAIEFASIGLLVASRAQTLETASGLMNFVMLPMWTLSGIFFSYERFPELFWPVIKALPLTPVIDALRALMMDGKSIFTLGPELLVMSLWCVIPFVLALAVFRWND